MIWNIRNIKPEQNEETIQKKMEFRECSGTSPNVQTSESGVLEEEEQDIENLLEKMRGNFPNLAKKIDIQVQEAQSLLNKLDPKKSTLRHVIIKIPTVNSPG